MADDKLLPCPFCGKAAKWFGVNSIGCTDQVDCGVSVDSGDSGARTAEFTLRSWQRRVCPALALETLRPFLKHGYECGAHGASWARAVTKYCTCGLDDAIAALAQPAGREDVPPDAYKIAKCVRGCTTDEQFQALIANIEFAFTRRKGEPHG